MNDPSILIENPRAVSAECLSRLITIGKACAKVASSGNHSREVEAQYYELAIQAFDVAARIAERSQEPA